MVTLAAIAQSFAPFDTEHGLAALESAMGITARGDVSKRVDSIVREVARAVARWERLRTMALLPEHNLFAALFAVIDRADMYAWMHSRDGLGAVGDKGITWPDCWWGHLAARLDDSGLWDRLWAQLHRETHAQMAQPTIKEERSASASNAAKASHVRDIARQQAMRAAWASGHYTSRDRCAEEECAALGMSFSAARKALRNTPDPA